MSSNPERSSALVQSGEQAERQPSDNVSSVGHCAAAVPVVVAALAWDHVDHHFASGRENLAAVYRCAGHSADTLTVTVHAADGTLVYQLDNAPSDDGRHPVGHQLAGWNGKGNQGVWNDVYVTAASSPYTITITATNSGRTDAKTFHVLCRAVSLALGTWTQDGNAPDKDGDRQRWVQYKLNQLGYFAGPLDGNIAAGLGNQSRRAMMRYSYDHPGLTEARARITAAYYNNAPFVSALDGDACGHTVVQGGRLPASGEEARLYVGYNYFYDDMQDYSADDGHLQKNATKLDRFEIPVEATVLLLAKNDADGTGAGVVSPEGVGAVKIQWTVTAEAEDLTRYPASTVNRPSKARAYFTTAALGNCPTALGGCHVTVNPNQNHFRIGDDLPPFTSANNNDDVYTTVYSGGVAGKRGKAGIIFRASYIAGDRYKLKAAVSFYGLANKNAIEAECLTTLGVTWQTKLSVTTGTMTVWHQQRVAAVVNWPAPTDRTIQWDDVAAEYAPAYTELDATGIVTMTGAQFRAAYPNDLRTLPPQLVVKFGVNPVALADNALFSFAIPAQGAKETAAKYKERVSNDLKQKFSVANLAFVGDIIQVCLKQNHRAGSVVIHAKWVPTLRVWHVPYKGLGSRTDEHDWDPAIFCIGLAAGVTIYSHPMYPKYSDQFVITHEMGHNRWLHHHTSGSDEMGEQRRTGLGLDAWHRDTNPCSNPISHDVADNHCTMSYPFALPQDPGWTPNGAKKSTFCGKCLLKLRGWNVVGNVLPATS